MRLVNVDEGKIYMLDWSMEIRNYFQEILETKYISSICNEIIDQVMEQVTIKYEKEEPVIFSEGCYYVVEDMKLVNVSLKNEILPQQKISNEFLKKVFESKDWEECISSAKLESDVFPVFNLQEIESIAKRYKSEVRKREDYLATLDSVLAEFFCEDLKAELLSRLENLAKLPENVVAEITLDTYKRYCITKSGENLELQEIKPLSDKVADVITSAFNGIKTKKFKK